MKNSQNTQAHTLSPRAPVSAADDPHLRQASAARSTKVTAGAPNFNEAPAGLKPIGGVLAGIIAGLAVPQE